MTDRVMTQMVGPFRRCLLALSTAIAINMLVFLAGPLLTTAGPVEQVQVVSDPPPASSQSCMDCHGKRDLEMVLSSGEKLSLYVDDAAMGGSVHGGKLVCTDCHSRVTDYPHKKVQAASKREYSMAQYEACKRCHFANYAQTMDSIHYQTLESGNREAPLCTDCHGYHAVTNPNQPKSKISQSCGNCHREISQEYSKSVHGAALESGASTDVPTCTDCHGAHRIRDASTAAFRLDSPQMCAKCHADANLMAKYGLSPNVLKTYLQDFHGTTVTLTKRHDQNVWASEAVCSDCHGVHEIKSARHGDAMGLKRSIIATCQKCHPDAGANFPDAWLSHYELSLGKAPLPWLVRAAYTVFIPFMITGLVLHLVVDLWRIARNR